MSQEPFRESRHINALSTRFHEADRAGRAFGLGSNKSRGAFAAFPGDVSRFISVPGVALDGI
jgi:hypothetical protein